MATKKAKRKLTGLGFTNQIDWRRQQAQQKTDRNRDTGESSLGYGGSALLVVEEDAEIMTASTIPHRNPRTTAKARTHQSRFQFRQASRQHTHTVPPTHTHTERELPICTLQSTRKTAPIHVVQDEKEGLLCNSHSGCPFAAGPLVVLLHTATSIRTSASSHHFCVCPRWWWKRRSKEICQSNCRFPFYCH